MVKIGIIGEVSVGKSTLLNALVSKYLSSTSLKRTTYVPFLFQNSDNPDTNETIEETINEANSNKEDLKEPVEFKTKISFSDDKTLSLIDFAGVNDGAEVDSKMENVFFNYLSNLDYVIYVTDSNSTMTLKSEREFFTKLSKKIKENIDNGNIIKLIVVFNKYDDIIEDDQEDSEVDEIISESKEFINDLIEYESFKISAQKMMVKNIISTNKSAIKYIPSTIVHKILCEYHGKKKAKLIIQQQKLKTSDIEEIEFSEEETSFMKYLNGISKLKNQNKIITQFIANEANKNSNINFDIIYSLLNKYEKYLEIKSVSGLFDCIYNLYLDKLTKLDVNGFAQCDKYYLKNEYTKLNEEDTNKKILTKINLNTEYNICYDRFILKEFNNFLKWKSRDEKTLEGYIKHISYDKHIKNMEIIKKTHDDIESISKEIDYTIIKYSFSNYYNIEYLLSMNENLNTSMCNYLNIETECNIKEHLRCLTLSKNVIPKDHSILEYKPLSINYQFIKKRFRYYPAKMVQYLNFMKDYEEDKKEKLKNNKKKCSSGHKHEIEIIDDEDNLLDL